MVSLRNREGFPGRTSVLARTTAYGFCAQAVSAAPPRRPATYPVTSENYRASAGP
jgi:hypothetical protein